MCVCVCVYTYIYICILKMCQEPDINAWNIFNTRSYVQEATNVCMCYRMIRARETLVHETVRECCVRVECSSCVRVCVCMRGVTPVKLVSILKRRSIFLLLLLLFPFPSLSLCSNTYGATALLLLILPHQLILHLFQRHAVQVGIMCVFADLLLRGGGWGGCYYALELYGGWYNALELYPCIFTCHLLERLHVVCPLYIYIDR